VSSRRFCENLLGRDEALVKRTRYEKRREKEKKSERTIWGKDQGGMLLGRGRKTIIQTMFGRRKKGSSSERKKRVNQGGEVILWTN